jgi:hypothetical protein
VEADEIMFVNLHEHVSMTAVHLAAHTPSLDERQNKSCIAHCVLQTSQMLIQN